MRKKFTFADFFSGIGGFHYGLHAIGGRCAVASDIDPHANETYKRNYGIAPLRDISDIDPDVLPDFDLLCAGFPCQSFSNVGPRGGLKDPRGALVYEIFRILKDKQPKAFILENVRGLENHNGGKTLAHIERKLKLLGYDVKHKVLEATDYGLPQIRKRLFIVGTLKKLKGDFKFPNPLKLKRKLSDIMKGETERDFAFTIRIGGRRSGIKNRFNWDCYLVNGKPRYITPKECLELQGFPRTFFLAGNVDKQMKQVGNSVPTTIIREIGTELIKAGVLT